jgi:predicted oxidoreductase (fatty acid repression mutant protein)
MSAPTTTAEFFKAISHRHSVYPLSDKVNVSDDRIVEIVQEILKYSPSPFNNQPMRVAIFLGNEHKKFWKTIRDQALPLLQGAGEEVVAAMTQRFDMFTGAYGSVRSSFTSNDEYILTHISVDHVLG